MSETESALTRDKNRHLPVVVSFLSLIVAALSLVVSAFIYFNARAAHEEAQRDAGERRKLHLTGTSHKDGSLDLKPTDSTFSLGAVTVMFAADTKIPLQYLLPGDHHLINLKENESALRGRATATNSYGFKSSDEILEYIPTFVSAEYFVEGRRLTSNALYQLFYSISKADANPTIRAGGLKYCGELPVGHEHIDFLIDGRFPTVFGYSDRPSTSTIFDCDAERLPFMTTEEGGRLHVKPPNVTWDGKPTVPTQNPP